jgi:hypothetical protein
MELFDVIDVIYLKGLRQQGHFVEVDVHYRMQLRQNLCEQLNRPRGEDGVSRQIEHRF